MFDIFKEVSKYLNGGNVSVDGGREGDWLEDKYGTGGRIKDSEINVGNRFGLINGEVVEIKKRFIDPRYRGDDRVVVFTRSSDGKEHENTVDTLRIFLNNTKAQLINKHTEEVLGEKYWTKYGNGGKVTYVGDYKTDTRTYYFRRYNNAIGSFGWKYNDKYNEGILYALDEYDKEYVGNVSLKNNEYIFRYKTDRMIGDAKYIIKINLDNALVYFLSEKGIELDEPIFESRGIKADYIIIDKTKISFKSIFSKGGEFEEEIWQIRNSAGKYYSRTMSGAENWSDSPDMGYTYTRQIGESMINILKKSGYTDLYLVKYDKDWYKKKDGGILSEDIQMAKSDVMKLEEYAKKISDNVMPNQDVEAWVISKISKVEQTTANVKHTLESEYPEMFADGGEIENTDGNTVRMMCLHIGKYAKSMLKAIDNGVVFESWMTHELSIAGNMIDSVFHYLDYFNSGNHLAHGGEMVKHLDIPNTMLDFTLKTKMDSGGSFRKENIRTLRNRFQKEKQTIALIIIADDIIMPKLDSAIKQIDWNSLTDSQKQQANKIYRDAKEFYGYKLLDDFLRFYYSNESIKNNYSGQSIKTMDKIKRTMSEIAESYPISDTFNDFINEVGYSKYQLGDMWSDDFDYEGMLQMALTINENWSIGELQSLYDSFEDVNYHTVNSYLNKIIDYIENGNINLAKAYIIIYKKKIAELLADEYSEQEASQMIMGGNLAQKRKVGKVMHEFKHGKLKSNDRVVTDRNQAIAIALSEAGISKKEEGGIISTFKLPSTDVIPLGQGGIPQYNTPLDHWALYYERGGKMSLGGGVKRYKEGERFYDEMGNEYRYAYYQKGIGHWLNDMRNNGILVFGGVKEIPNRFSKINKALL